MCGHHKVNQKDAINEGMTWLTLRSFHEDPPETDDPTAALRMAIAVATGFTQGPSKGIEEDKVEKSVGTSDRLKPLLL